MTLTSAEKDFAKTIRVPVKEKFPNKLVVRKHMPSINAPVTVHKKVGDQYLVELSSGDMRWIPESDTEDI